MERLTSLEIHQYADDTGVDSGILFATLFGNAPNIKELKLTIESTMYIPLSHTIADPGSLPLLESLTLGVADDLNPYRGDVNDVLNIVQGRCHHKLKKLRVDCCLMEGFECDIEEIEKLVGSFEISGSALWNDIFTADGTFDDVF